VVVAVSTVVVVSMGQVLVPVVSMEDVSAVAVSTAVAFVAAVLVAAAFTAVAFVVAVLVGAITDSPMMSSSAASAFRGGGAGAIRTAITRTAMDTAGTVTTVAPVIDITMAADQSISGVFEGGGKPSYGSLKSLAF
jgi:hypothetical protein